MLTPFTRKTLTRVSFLVWLLISALILPLSSLAGQTVVIDKHVTHPKVLGNGDLPDGDVSSNPASLLDPNNNTVQVLPGGQVDGGIIGGYSVSVYGTATTTGNSVSMRGGQVAYTKPGLRFYGVSVFFMEQMLPDCTLSGTRRSGP